MKSKLTLVLTALTLTVMGGNVFAGESQAVYNNRGQLIGTAIRSEAAPRAEAAPKKKLIFNNRHQVIAVVETPSR